MKIGEVAERSGVTAKMIRHYEAIELVPAPPRKSSNYRDYSNDDVHRLAFVARARGLGFSLNEVGDLLKLWADKDRASADVKRLTQNHISALDEKIKHLQEMRDTLGSLSKQCDGNKRAHCPIIENLAGEVLKKLDK